MRRALGLAVGVVLFGCTSADGTRVSGEVTRSIAISEMGDGKGALHIGLSNTCLEADGTAPQAVLDQIIDDADLSDDDAHVHFELSGEIEDGTYFAAAWFDDVDNPDQDEDLPGKGDLAMFSMATPICVEVEIEDGQPVSGLELVLNYEMPFNLTGRMGDEGVLDGGGGSASDADIDLDDPNTYDVTFTLTRSVDPAEGGDGVGQAVFALNDICFDVTGAPPMPVYSIEVDDVDLSAAGAEVELEFEGVKNGIYQLNGYLDDVGMHTVDAPLPSTGDMVRFGGFGPGCVEVVVNGGHVTTAYDLNFVMTWDLNM